MAGSSRSDLALHCHTFEEAIIKMAALVAEVYGDNRARVYGERLLASADQTTVA